MWRDRRVGAGGGREFAEGGGRRELGAGSWKRILKIR